MTATCSEAPATNGSPAKESVSPQAASSAFTVPPDGQFQNPPRGLHLPELPEDVDTLTAALAYAKAGWFVGPCDQAQKSPGSILGAGWQLQTSHDPEQIVAWFAGESPGLFLHVGRSGAVVLDVDDWSKLPAELLDLIGQYRPPFQSTRLDDPERGHYVFAQPDDRLIGNGLGKLPKGWGEVRGKNGVVVVQPTRHEKDGARYLWKRTGPVPLSPELAALLPDAQDSQDPATDATVRGFRAEHVEALRPGALQPALDRFAELVRSGASRHTSAVEVACWLAREAAAGYYPAADAFDRLGQEFTAALHGTPDRFPRSEFAGIVAWAVGQVTPEQVAAKRAALRPAEVRESLSGGASTSTPEEPAPTLDAHAAFWGSSPQLQHVRGFARARRCSPYAALGVCLARVTTTAPCHVVLPPLVGSVASLNLFVALVGPSGAGKGAAEHAASDMFDMGPVETASVGSGEGIGHLYAHREKGEVVRDRESVLFSVPEVDTIASLGGAKGRQGSTLMPQLRQAWSGEALGFAYADAAKRLPIPRHSYRLSLLLGVQPGRAAGLLEEADGGTPQRFVWVPTLDPDAPDAPPSAPEPLRVPAQLWPPPSHGQLVLPVPPEAAAAIDGARLARLRGEGEALDGHELLCRLKVAAALALLEGRRVVADIDWERSGHVMAVSNHTRRGVERHLAQQAERANLYRGQAEGARAVVAKDTEADATARRVAPKVLSRLKAARGEQTYSEARRATTSRDRAAFDDALERLVDAGQVVRVQTDHGERLRLSEAAS